MEADSMTLRPTERLSRYRRPQCRHTMPLVSAERLAEEERERAEMQRALSEHDAKVAVIRQSDDNRNLTSQSIKR